MYVLVLEIMLGYMTTSAIDILRAYLDINDISPKEHILEAGALLIERPETIVINYAKK